MHVIETLSPVFIIIGIGYFLRRTGFFSSDFVDGLSKLVYWVALPSLLFYKIAISSYDLKSVGLTALVLFIGMVASVICAYIYCFFRKIKGPTQGSFVQGTIRGNLMYIGLPIVIYGFSNSSMPNDDIEALAILVMAPLIPIYNFLSVVVILASQHQIDLKTPAKITYRIITNPLIISSLAGIIYAVLFPSMPVVADRVLDAISQASLPLALLTVGAALAFSNRNSSVVSQSVASSLIKIGISPLAGFIAAYMMGLGEAEMKIAMIYLACPTATATYVLADQLRADKNLAASIVVYSTVLSIASLSAVLWLI